MRSISGAAVFLLVFCAALEARDVAPELSDEIIFNPGTGWQMMTTAGPEEVRRGLEEMPLMSVYYYRTVWTAFEPAREKYAGSPAVATLDRIRELVKAKNRYYATRAVTYNSKAPGYSRFKVNGCESAVPPYVYEELGAKGFEEPGGAKNWVPVFWDEIYIERYNKLAEFLGTRYAGDPSLAYIDIGGGNWGEMNLRNTGIPSLDNLSVWREHGLTPDSWHNMIVKLVDGYRRAFPKDQIIMASDFGSYGKADTRDYAIKNGIGFRDDGLGMDYSRAGRRNVEFERHWPEVLCMFENGYVDWTDAAGSGWGNPEAVRSTLDWAINQCHASIVMVGKGRGAFEAYRVYEPLVKEFGKKLGYRLAVTKASYHDPATSGGSWGISLFWENLGNAPPYRDYAVEISLLSGANVNYRYIIPSDKAQTRKWLPGKPFVMNLSLALPSTVSSGRKAVTVALCDPERPDDPKFRINLAHKTTDEFKRALIGPVEVKARGLTSLGGGETGAVEAAVSGADAAAAYPEIRKALEANQYKEALALIEAKRAGAGAGEDAARSLEVLALRARRGIEAVKAVVDNVERVKGRRISVNLAGMRAQGIVRGASADALLAEAAGMEVSVPWQDVTPYTLYGLARDALQASPKNSLFLAKFLMDIGRNEEAAKELGELLKAPEVADEAREMLKGL